MLCAANSAGLAKMAGFNWRSMVCEKSSLGSSLSCHLEQFSRTMRKVQPDADEQAMIAGYNRSEAMPIIRPDGLQQPQAQPTQQQVGSR